jgi:hypothetical protein
LVGGEYPLPQADGFRSDFDQLIVVDELQRLLERELAKRHQADGFDKIDKEMTAGDTYEIELEQPIKNLGSVLRRYFRGRRIIGNCF